MLLGQNETLNALNFAVRFDDCGAAQSALPFRIFLGKDVALIGLQAANLPRSCDGEALFCAAVGFHLWHDSLTDIVNRSIAGLGTAVPRSPTISARGSSSSIFLPWKERFRLWPTLPAR